MYDLFLCELYTAADKGRTTKHELHIITEENRLNTVELSEREAEEFRSFFPPRTKAPTKEAEILHGARYNQLRDRAWKALIESGIDELPVDPLKIIKYNGWKVLDFERGKKLTDMSKIDLNGIKGVTLKSRSSDSTVILYDSSLASLEEKRTAITHEIAHILMDHNGENAVTHNEAERMLTRILMPAAVLHECNIGSAEEIASLCGVPLSYAAKRYARLKALKDRGRWRTSKLENLMLWQFSDFIERYKRGRINEI